MKIKRYATALLTSLLLSSCHADKPDRVSEQTDRQQQVLDGLAWLKTANPEQDARVAIERGDLRLLRTAGRSASIPGLPSDQASELRRKCGIAVVPGTGDVVYGDEHLALLRKARRYAERYNQIMIDACR